jgi:sec-independent protein translocase protein TatA
MFGLGVPELIIIGVIILFIFGAKRIPEIGKGLGGAIREFKNIGKELKGSDSKTDSKPDNSKKLLNEGKNNEPSIEAKMAKKVIEQVPGVKKVMDINDKVNKVKEIIK